MKDLWGSMKIDVPRRNSFNLSHEHKGTCNHGKLVPIFWREVLPGETWNIDTQIFVRAVPMLAPIMHFMNISVDTFYVPNRLMCSYWEAFITSADHGVTAPAHPQFQLSDVYGIGGGPVANWLLRTGQVLDKLGFPTLDRAGVTFMNATWNTMKINAFPLKAYGLICDTWFRNESLQASQLSATFASDNLMNIADLTFCATLQSAYWQKDYFTASMPTAQRGPAGVAPVVVGSTGYTGSSPLNRRKDTGAPAAPGAISNTNVTGSSTIRGGGDAMDLYYDPQGTMTVTASAIRVAEKIQKFAEKQNVSGPKYIEQLRMFFGVISSDARLQRAEYCGGGRSQLVITEVMQNSASNTQPTPLATIAGRALDHSSHRMGGYFEEHGILMSILRIVPANGYMNLMDRAWLHQVFGDYYFADFAHLGEQVVYQCEPFADLTNGAAGTGAFNTWSYNPRFSEYKFAPNIATGDQKESLNYWNLNRKLGNTAVFGDLYSRVAADFRIFADTVATDDHYIYQIVHRVNAKRPIPYYSEPGLV